MNDALFESAYKANKYANISCHPHQHWQHPICGHRHGGRALALINGLGAVLPWCHRILQLSKSLTSPISQISQQLNSVVMALAGAQRIFDLMDEPSEDHGTVTLVNVSITRTAPSRKPVSAPICGPGRSPGDGELRLYQAGGRRALYDVDFAYEEGKPSSTTSAFSPSPAKLAFVGATGAGKTTITNLINRFYDIADGKIHYDGISINDIHSRICAAPGHCGWIPSLPAMRKTSATAI